jgi:hypothetical protein
MHPPEIERERERAEFDPIAEGSRYRLDRELSLAIWTRVCAEIQESAGRHDAEQARRRFHELAARIAARGGRLRPDVGRVTRVDIEAHGVPLAVWSGEDLGPCVPGRQTLVSADAASRHFVGADLAPRVPGRQTLVSAGAASRHSVNEVAPARGVSEESPRSELPGASEVMQAMDALQAPQRQDRVTPLEHDLGARMSRLFAFDVRRVAVVPESPAVTGSTKAVTKGDEVHFRPGAYQPGTPAGDRLIAHELAHVVQQQGGRGERTGTRTELEREADRAAHLVARGDTASIQLRADRTAAYAFDEGDAHEPDVEEAQLDKKDEKHDEAAKARGGEADAGTAREDAPAQDGPAPGDAAKQDAPPDTRGAEAAEHDTDAGIDEGSVSAVIPAEDAPPGPPGVGGGPPAKPQKEAPPSVAAAKPEAGLAQLHGVRPDRLGLLFGQLHTAAAADVAQERAKLAANPPKQMSTGGPAGAAAEWAKGGPPKVGGTKGAASNAGADPKAGETAGADPKAAEVADHPVKGEVPGGESDKQAKQGKAAEQQKAASQIIANTEQSNASWFGSWSGHGERGGDASAPKMSDAETRQMSGSLDQLPTKAPDVATDPGPAPELAMKGEARTSTAQDRAKLDTTTAGLESQGRADSRAPMGEDHIDPTAAPEELTAAALPGGAAPAGPALPTVAGAASSEEVGIIAQEQHGPEIDAALTKASADATAERAKHAQEEDKARAESDAHIRELKTKADADQAAARTTAQAEVHEARGQWQAEIDKKGRDARTQADKKVADGMAQVSAEEAKANAEAQQHVDEGKRKAEEEKQKGEKEAADAKEKGKQKSSGFFGWLASKAKAAFDGIKQAVHAAIDACRKAVRAVIDAAKKLAMAAINLAREVIVAAIKAVGQALIAISNVLLAAFPALKARFQGLIRKAVDKAVDTVNKLADGLKKAVQKALDLLGAALDKALQLLEKGLDAIIDAANAVVQGAIKAAQAVALALGSWAQLIKDIASGPAAWIGKLGASVWDGIKNQLWPAFKTTVIDWFKGKVFELLGIGGMILEFLLEGGLTREHILQMALDALMVAIPSALIAILIEKLVALIIPAVGAVMAIIEGLQAAWGTISRIIAAFGAFMTFLLAVKGGGAGALFAAVLAAAAVAVLEFVASWLLRKLASAARKVGGKLKGLAEKFKAKRKAKKDARAKHHDEHDPHGKKRDHDGHGDKKKDKHDDDHAKAEKEKKQKEEKDKKNQEILAKAKQELPPKIRKVLDRGIRGVLLKARLGMWKLQYRLSALEITGGHDFQIRARVNPTADLIGGITMDADELLAFVRQVAEKMRTSPRVKEDAAKIKASEHEKELPTRPKDGDSPRMGKEVDIAPRTSHMAVGVGLDQSGALPRGKVRDVTALTPDGKVASTVRQQQPPWAPLTPEGTPRGSTQIVKEPKAVGSGFEPGDYAAMAARLAPTLPSAARGPAVVEALEEFALTGQAPRGITAGQLHALRTTLFGAEYPRSPAAGPFGQMSLDLMKAGHTPEAILGEGSGGLFPLSPPGVGRDLTVHEERMAKVARRETVGEPNAAADRQMKREVEIIRAWLRTLTDLKFSDKASMADKQQQIKDEIERRMMKSVE